MSSKSCWVQFIYKKQVKISIITEHKMIKNIQGKKYNFEIVAENECFCIKAKHKDTRRFSCINNLNIVLSELCSNINNINDDRFQDSQWIISNNEIKNFEKTAK